MSKMKWRRACYENGRTQFYPDVLEEALLKYMEGAGCTLMGIGDDKRKNMAPADVTEIGIDYGGMCPADMYDLEIPFPKCKFIIPARDVGMCIEHLVGMKERDDLGIPYYKINAQWHAVLLLPQDYGKLLASLMEIEAEASEVEDAEFKRLSASIQLSNAKAGKGDEKLTEEEAQLKKDAADTRLKDAIVALEKKLGIEKE